ncbi:hypothetical protein SCH01S_51_00160 [Sphingomonas changbaiensis NBRC 104936]|uniref:Uncharacterized protein n=1 Tax=Sphingomonas changbaiensis NBRC 104936 TaxID=1219043 RepID=A0A0E9MU67_9SPHN|nr:hypothetical protein [Sphingomonas changbaiensis]GAO40685.1 hypothetical protein SCH01S_51_00160 [Sphingomonas changbaiensis NBRC 104936]
MTKLAKEFSLSDVALHKICRKYHIPTPPVGYWAKKAHGKPVKLAPLPTDKASGASDAVLVIHEGAGTSESEAMSEARAQALNGLAERSSSEHQPVSPIITRTIEKLGKARPDRLGLVNVSGGRLITAAMRPDSAERARKVLEALDAAAQAAGFSLGYEGDRAAWRARGEHVGFEIAEVADRYEHTPTEAELKAVAKWEAEEEARFKRYGYRSGYGRPQIPEWEQRFEGRLAVRLEEVRIRTENQYWGPTIPRTFTDTKTRDLLNMIPRIMSTIAAIGVAKRENREADERRRIADEQAAIRRAEQERRARVERQRTDLLERLLDDHGKLVRLEAFVAAFRAPTPDPSEFPHTARFRLWLEERLARLRASLASGAVEDRLSRSSLFEEDLLGRE